METPVYLLWCACRAANVRNQDFRCDRPDRKWAVDIRYIWTSACWLHLAIGVDLYYRWSVAWEARDRMKKALAISVVHKSHCDPATHAVTDPDLRQGAVFQCDGRKICKARNIIPSMRGKGHCNDTAMVETVCTPSMQRGSGALHSRAEVR